jgi:hypothetical protein
MSASAISQEVPASDEAHEAANQASTGPLPPPEDYAERVRALHDVAIARRELEPLVDALAAGLAWVICNLNRPDVTGDVLVKLGRHVERYAELERAQTEMDELRERGCKPS